MASGSTVKPWIAAMSLIIHLESDSVWVSQTPSIVTIHFSLTVLQFLRLAYVYAFVIDYDSAYFTHCLFSYFAVISVDALPLFLVNIKNKLITQGRVEMFFKT